MKKKTITNILLASWFPVFIWTFCGINEGWTSDFWFGTTVIIGITSTTIGLVSIIKDKIDF
jgi:hypothetical protein